MNKLNKSFDLSASTERFKGEIFGGQESLPVVLDCGGEGREGAKSGVSGDCGGNDAGAAAIGGEMGSGANGEQKC